MVGVDDGVAFGEGEAGWAGVVVAAAVVVAVAGTVGVGESPGPLHPTNKAAAATMASPVLMRRHSAALT